MTKNEWVMARYYDRKAKGLCVDCGEPAMKGYVRCFRCEVRNCEKANKTHHKKVDVLEGAITEVAE